MAEADISTGGNFLNEFSSREGDDADDEAVSLADFMEAKYTGCYLPLTFVNSLGQRQCLLDSLQPSKKSARTSFVSDGRNGMDQLPTATQKLLCNDLCNILEGVHKEYKMRIGGSHFKTVMVEQELRSMQLMKSQADNSSRSPDDLQQEQQLRKKVSKPKSSPEVIHV